MHFQYIGPTIEDVLHSLWSHQNPSEEIDFFREIIEDDLALINSVEENQGEPTNNYREKHLPKQITRKDIFSFLLKAAVFLIFSFSLIYMDSLLKRERSRPQVAAIITESIQPKWAGVETPYEVGSWLYTGDETMRLQEGLVKVKFDHGTEVILEAPCDINFLSPNKMRLDLGRLYAKVTQKGQGFTVAAPGCNIVDRGTEFGVIVTKEGQSETHVLDGQVELWEEKPVGYSQTPYRLHKGQVGSFNEQGDICIEERHAQPLAFVRSLDPEMLKAGYVRMLTRMSGLVSYWNLNEIGGTTAADSVPGDVLDGNNIGTYFGSGVTLGEAGPRPANGFLGFGVDNRAPCFSDDVNSRLQMVAHHVSVSYTHLTLPTNREV